MLLSTFSSYLANSASNTDIATRYSVPINSNHSFFTTQDIYSLEVMLNSFSDTDYLKSMGFNENEAITFAKIFDEAEHEDPDARIFLDFPHLKMIYGEYNYRKNIIVHRPRFPQQLDSSLLKEINHPISIQNRAKALKELREFKKKQNPLSTMAEAEEGLNRFSLRIDSKPEMEIQKTVGKIVQYLGLRLVPPGKQTDAYHYIFTLSVRIRTFSEHPLVGNFATFLPEVNVFDYLMNNERKRIHTLLSETGEVLSIDHHRAFNDRVSTPSFDILTKTDFQAFFYDKKIWIAFSEASDRDWLVLMRHITDNHYQKFLHRIARIKERMLELLVNLARVLYSLRVLLSYV